MKKILLTLLTLGFLILFSNNLKADTTPPDRPRPPIGGSPTPPPPPPPYQ